MKITRSMITILLLAAGISLPLPLSAESPTANTTQPTPPHIIPLPDVVPNAIADRQDAQVPDRVRFDVDGMLGARIQANTINRLLEVPTDRLLEGYRKRPGRQTWDGEHIGKWLHAASLAWANSGDERLHAKITSAVAELTKCQQEDGYLGTYLPEKRWTSWDVWAHKYNLIGLITWMRLSGDRSALDCCRRMGDLLCREFGEGKRDLNTSGGHAGLASGSVLEPMVLLYRFTGEQRYREFCRYILRDWETATGPHLVSRLLEAKRVDVVGNGKAYEMLSCINGLLEWYRLTGEKDALNAAENAWKDITAKREYITGTASYCEHFHDDYELPNVNKVGETCVTVTWLQFNLHLLRLTGQACYAQELERIVYNQLPGAQRPDGRAWGYYVQMQGTKPYSSSLDGHCCLSSGPRGIALIPTFALATDADGIVVNLHEAGRANLNLRNGLPVVVDIATSYPSDSRINITVKPDQAAAFTVKVRIPNWCPAATLKLGDQTLSIAADGDGYAAVRRIWQPGDQLTLVLPPTPRVVLGDHSNQGRACICYGPLVLAADAALDPTGRQSIQLAGSDATALGITPEPATGLYRDCPHAQVFRIAAEGGDTLLAPFATAGVGTRGYPDQAGPKAIRGSRYQVWLRIAGIRSADGNLLAGGTDTRSRAGNMVGSIIESEMVTTWDGTKSEQDWYAVTLTSPVTLRKVVFTHGKRFHDGGWFDTSADKPQVQIQSVKEGPWITVGELTDYPVNTATESNNLAEGARFTCRLAQPVQAMAVRVIGKPASGDAPGQAFSSCGGLHAFLN